MDTACSVNGVLIRLTYERWYHILENHEEMAGYYHDVLDVVESPEFVVRGGHGTLKAARNIGKRGWLVVIYREVSILDGFVITAYTLEGRPKGEVIWKR